MTYAGHSFMGTESQHAHRPSQRLALYLRGQYRRDHRSSALSRDIECTAKAAENILNGHWPNDRHFAAIVGRFGRDVLDAVFGPEIDETVSRLTAKARELEQQLQEVRALQRQATGFEPQPDLFPARADHPVEDRTAALIRRFSAPLRNEAAPPD